MVLPPTSATVRLADVMSSCLQALGGEDNPLALSPVTKAAVVLIDGMGAANLEFRRGHARWLTAAWRHRGLVADSGFPSTTASSLASLTTGTHPGEHGIVGYTVRDPASGVVINHLKDWEPHVDPALWQRSRTVFELAADAGIPSLSFGERRFAGTGFTQAVWRGARFVGTESLEEQFVGLREFFDAHDRALAYLYWPALDRTGHSSGVESEAWTRRLEDLDQMLRSLDSVLTTKEGAIITADHGMVDVMDEAKLLVPESSSLLHGVTAWAGEPRVAQLHIATPDALADLSAAWQETVGQRGIVVSREEAIERGMFGPVHDLVRERIGDILVCATGDIAFYRQEKASPQSMKMIGQHGSITPTEREVPVIPLGEWA